jgi:hypothetical protein
MCGDLQGLTGGSMPTIHSLELPLLDIYERNPDKPIGEPLHTGGGLVFLTRKGNMLCASLILSPAIVDKLYGMELDEQRCREYT